MLMKKKIARLGYDPRFSETSTAGTSAKTLGMAKDSWHRHCRSLNYKANALKPAQSNQTFPLHRQVSRWSMYLMKPKLQTSSLLQKSSWMQDVEWRDKL
jgi:hypothetical protein